MAGEVNALLTFEKDGPITIGTVCETRMLDERNVVQFGKELASYATRHDKPCLLLNFQHVDYLSSAVLAELLQASRAAEKRDGRICLWGLSPNIQEVFQITNLDKVFTIYHTDECAEAVKRFKRALEIEAKEKEWGTD